MRVLFVSDTHVGFDLPARPRVERRRRGPDFLRNFELALAPALAGEVDVVLHGGDLLFRSRVPPSLAELALAPLKRVAARGIPVLLVPGNHERSALPYPMLALHENLFVFDRPRTCVLSVRGLDVAFSGFPYARRVRGQLGRLLAEAGYGAAPAQLRVVCLHHCIEGATCGPGNFVFRSGDDVIQLGELPAGAAAVLSGHIHRHQVLRPPGGPPVVYAGSVERTSFAEAPETKGYVVLELGASGLVGLEHRALPARPMVTRALDFDEAGPGEALALLREAIDSTPPDAVLRLQLDRPPSASAAPWLRAAALRSLAGQRTVSVSGPWRFEER